MPRLMGVWIDHKKAVIVQLLDQEVRTTTFESGVEPRTRFSGGSRSKTAYGPQEVASESRRDSRHKQQLDRFYERLLGEFIGADQILILGPGEAKGELANMLKSSKPLRSRVVAVKPADKLTERQIVAEVREYFGGTKRRLPEQ